MKILIICGCLEPGKDGVGDYSLRIGAWLESQGHVVTYLAMNDRFVRKGNSESGNSMYRLNASDSWNARFRQTQKYLDDLQPDFIFFQYVPYAYHHKGMPLNFISDLKSLKTDSSWIFMIHEAYIDGKLKLKDRVIRWFQKLALQRLVNQMGAKEVYTSTLKYQSMLREIGISSQILPLFGNIPIVNDSRDDDGTSTSYLGVFFGAPPKPQTFDEFSSGLNQLTDKQDLKISLCGRQSPNSRLFHAHLIEHCPNVEIEVLGELDADDLSRIFIRSDFGIARISPDLIGKSGAAIAMLEHGLKLWIPLAQNQEEIKEKVLFRSELCYSNLNKLFENKEIYLPKSNLDNTGHILLSALAS